MEYPVWTVLAVVLNERDTAIARNALNKCTLPFLGA